LTEPNEETCRVQKNTVVHVDDGAKYKEQQRTPGEQTAVMDIRKKACRGRGKRHFSAEAKVITEKKPIGRPLYMKPRIRGGLIEEGT